MRIGFIRRWIPVLFVAVALALAAAAIERDWDALGSAISKIGFAVVLGSLASGVIAVAMVMLVWRSLLIGLGAHPRLALSASMYYVSQVGKYLPGSVWPIVAQMEFGRREHIKRPTLLAANLLTLALNLAVGLTLAAICVTLTSPHAIVTYWWALLALPVLFTCLHPRTIPYLINVGLRIVGRRPVDECIEPRALFIAAGWAAISWIVLGAHFYLLIHALGANGASAFPAAVGGMAFAVVLGILAVPVPAGAGVRDAVLAAALAGRVGPSAALAAALTSRVLLIVADFLLAALAASTGRLRRSDVPTELNVSRDGVDSSA